jgi:predicted ester cyclase
VGQEEDRNRKLVAKLYERGWGCGDLAVIGEVFAPNHVLHWNENAPSLQQRTTDEVKSIVRAYRDAFPDLEVTIDNMVAEGDYLAVQVTFVGTHMGVYEGFRPTNKKSRFTDMQILRFENGKIAESFLGPCPQLIRSSFITLHFETARRQVNLIQTNSADPIDPRVVW